MVHCCVPFCNSDSAKKITGVSFHEIPVDESSRQKWLKAISRQDVQEKANKSLERAGQGKPWQPGDRAKVCSLHFMPSDYKQGTKYRCLLPTAVPSNFQGYPSYMQQPTKQPRRSLKKAISLQPKKRRRIASPENPSESLDGVNTVGYQNFIDVPPLPESSCSRPQSQVTGIASSVSTVSASTTLTCAKIATKHLKYKNLQKKCRRLAHNLAIYKQRVATLKHANEKYAEQLANFNVNSINDGCTKGDNKALFLKEQLQAFGKKKHRWSHKTIKYCVLWHSKSPNAYRFVRGAKLLSLPSRSSLKRYVGSTSGANISTLIKQRLHNEASRLSELEKFCSLVLDEMAIKPSYEYLKAGDEFMGNVSMGELETDVGVCNILANRLLCFLLVGLSTSYKIPVAYFFTNGLKGPELNQLVLQVIADVEKATFKVVRLVADNHSTNVKMFSILSGGEPQPEVQHPQDPSRVLYLSYDACHILKNFRSLLLATNREMRNAGQPVSGHFVRALYQLQKSSVIKPVRKLTYKHVYPTNLEKMNVGRAVDIFSVDVIAALNFLKQYGERFGVTSFKEAEGTIQFLQNIRKWFTILNVGFLSTQPDATHFVSVDDERLCWLEHDFINYLENWKQSCKKEAVEFISKETYGAACLTTRSAVGCIRYLLNNGFHYVLTRKFTSDAIENLFSALRRLGGSNDQATAATVVNNLHKVLVTGMITGSLSSNAPSDPCEEWFDGDAQNHPSCTTSSEHRDVMKEVRKQMDIHGKLLAEKPCNTPLPTVENATMAYIGGYLSRVVEENIECSKCANFLSIPQSASPLMALIKDKDFGGLRYPRAEFVVFLLRLKGAVDAVLPFLHRNPKIMKMINSLMLPWVMKNPMFSCGDNSHCARLCDLILTKFIRPYLSNYSRTVTDQHKRQHRTLMEKKPLSIKMLKVIQA